MVVYGVQVTPYNALEQCNTYRQEVLAVSLLGLAVLFRRSCAMYVVNLCGVECPSNFSLGLPTRTSMLPFGLSCSDPVGLPFVFLISRSNARVELPLSPLSTYIA